jgi:hypothetical protein
MRCLAQQPVFERKFGVPGRNSEIPELGVALDCAVALAFVPRRPQPKRRDHVARALHDARLSPQQGRFSGQAAALCASYAL